MFAYNQVAFIREAVEAAFAQTYGSLEIVLSDDHSTDGTFEAMEELAKQYRGQHSIVLNHNPSNLGIGDHVNKIGRLATGEFIVLAAGDDISLPHRTDVLVRHWLEFQDQVFSVYSNMLTINQHGEEQGVFQIAKQSKHNNTPSEAIRNATAGVYGCTQGVDRRLFDDFDPLAPQIVHEDEVLPFRALLLGRIQYVHEVLVKYRRHDSNTWNSGPRSKKARKSMASDKFHRHQTWLSDTEKMDTEESCIDHEDIARLQKLIQASDFELQCCSRNIFSSLLKSGSALGKGVPISKLMRIIYRLHVQPLVKL